jgi:hypothetical protein
VFAWMGINPARKLLKISARQAKIRLIVFLIFIFLVAAGALIYKLLMDKL